MTCRVGIAAPSLRWCQRGCQKSPASRPGLRFTHRQFSSSRVESSTYDVLGTPGHPRGSMMPHRSRRDLGAFFSEQGGWDGTGGCPRAVEALESYISGLTESGTLPALSVSVVKGNRLVWASQASWPPTAAWRSSPRSPTMPRPSISPFRIAEGCPYGDDGRRYDRQYTEKSPRRIAGFVHREFISVCYCVNLVETRTKFKEELLCLSNTMGS
jgi:hypothetical protein